jgi:DNA-directed RNA polymerase subunit E'/Rpb7
MENQLTSPYINTIQNTCIQILPYQMNSDIESNMEINLKQKVEKKCNKYGYIDKVYTIDNYEEGELVKEHFLGAANYNISYQCRLCLPIEKTMIIGQVHIVDSELIIAKNGPIIMFIPKTNIDTSIWEINNVITHKITSKKLEKNDYVKIIIDKVKVNQNDTQIKTMCILYDYTTSDETKKYFGSIIDEKEEDNFIL